MKVLKIAVFLSLILCFLLIGVSVFFYLVIYIPSTQAAKSAKEKEKRVMLADCLRTADEAYNSQWASTCKSHAQVVKDGYQNCLKTALGADSCLSVWGKPDSSESCNLPAKLADGLNNDRKQQRDECFKLYSVAIR